MDLFIHSFPTWLELASLALCVGVLVCRSLVLAPAAGNEQPYHRDILKRMGLLFGVSLAAVAASALAELLVRTAEMSGSPIRTVLPLLPAVLVKTHFGKVWLVRVACLVLISVLAMTGRKHRDSRSFSAVLLVLAAVIAMTESAAGHAADSGDFSLSEVMDWLHLAGALTWGGGLFVLSLAVLPPLVKAEAPAARVLANVAARFSRIAGIAVGTVFLTALYQARMYIGSLPALFGSPYGRIVATKAVLFLLLIVLAAFNRFIAVPRLKVWAGPAPDAGGAGRFTARFFPRLTERPLAVRFMRSVTMEAVLIIGVLLCASLLRHEVPALHFSHHGHAGSAHLHHPGTGPEPVVSIETRPRKLTAGTPVSLLVRLQDRKGRPLEGLTVHHERILHAVIIGSDLKVFAHIHPEDVGPITRDMVKKAEFPLLFTFPKAGRYLVGLDFSTDDGLYAETVALDVIGRPGMTGPEVNTSREKDFGPYHVRLNVPEKNIHAGTETTVRFIIERDGKPVSDLKPYLGAPMHLSVVRSDLSRFMHVHGYPPGDEHLREGHREAAPSERYGPELDADLVFPVKGTYKLFCQVNHEDRVLLFDFMVNVR